MLLTASLSYHPDHPGHACGAVVDEGQVKLALLQNIGDVLLVMGGKEAQLGIRMTPGAGVVGTVGGLDERRKEHLMVLGVRQVFPQGPCLATYHLVRPNFQSIVQY